MMLQCKKIGFERWINSIFCDSSPASLKRAYIGSRCTMIIYRLVVESHNVIVKIKRIK